MRGGDGKEEGKRGGLDLKIALGARPEVLRERRKESGGLKRSPCLLDGEVHVYHPHDHVARGGENRSRDFEKFPPLVRGGLSTLSGKERKGAKGKD